MPRRALLQRRPWLVLSLLAGFAYPILDATMLLGGVWLMLVKGAAVGGLALYAARNTRGLGAGLFVLVMALAALGDMAIQLNFIAGGIAFFASHVAAIIWYRRYPRPEASVPNRWLAAAFLLWVPALSFLLSRDILVGIYGVAIGAMAATAWLSLFPLWRIRLGVLLFIFSDLLIFSRLGPYDLAPLPDLLVWPTYYLGQFLIATSVVQALRRFRR